MTGHTTNVEKAWVLDRHHRRQLPLRVIASRLGYDRPSFKIAFRDPWGNTVSETELIYNPTLKFVAELQLE